MVRLFDFFGFFLLLHFENFGINNKKTKNADVVPSINDFKGLLYLIHALINKNKINMENKLVVNTLINNVKL